MKIISDYSKDTQTEKQDSGSYEWWYFDALSVDGFKIVVIFYDGNPFSTRYINAMERGKKPKAEQFPAVSISVYKGDKPVFYSFREVVKKLAVFGSDIPYGKIENCRFRGQNSQTRLKFILNLDQELANGDSIHADLTFTSDSQSLPNFQSTGFASGSHQWNLVMPSGYVNGKIKISGYEKSEITFKGLGYHDHNTGSGPLKNSFDEWYWGRYHLEDSTFIYYLMKHGKIWENNAWLIGKNGTVFSCENIKISNYGMSLFGLKTARTVECGADGKRILIRMNAVLDNGPFYQRFGGRLLLKDDQTGVKEERGISEYLRPERIMHKKFWPLVNMRIAYPGKVHWVQKNPVLYRWTW